MLLVTPFVLSITGCNGNPVTEGVWVTLGVCVPDRVIDGVKLAVALCVSVTDGVFDNVGVTLAVDDWERVWDAVWVCVCDALDVLDGVAEDDRVSVPVPLFVAVPLPV